MVTICWKKPCWSDQPLVTCVTGAGIELEETRETRRRDARAPLKIALFSTPSSACYAGYLSGCRGLSKSSHQPKEKAPTILSTKALRFSLTEKNVQMDPTFLTMQRGIIKEKRNSIPMLGTAIISTKIFWRILETFPRSPGDEVGSRLVLLHEWSRDYHYFLHS